MMNSKKKILKLMGLVLSISIIIIEIIALTIGLSVTFPLFISIIILALLSGLCLLISNALKESKNPETYIPPKIITPSQPRQSSDEEKRRLYEYACHQANARHQASTDRIRAREELLASIGSSNQVETSQFGEKI